MPPASETGFAKPRRRSAAAPRAERPPLRQYSTTGRSRSELVSPSRATTEGGYRLRFRGGPAECSRRPGCARRRIPRARARPRSGCRRAGCAAPRASSPRGSRPDRWPSSSLASSSRLMRMLCCIAGRRPMPVSQVAITAGSGRARRLARSTRRSSCSAARTSANACTRAGRRGGRFRRGRCGTRPRRPPRDVRRHVAHPVQRRIEAALREVGLADVAGQRARGRHEHLVRHARCAHGDDAEPDAREDVGVVALPRHEAPAVAASPGRTGCPRRTAPGRRTRRRPARRCTPPSRSGSTARTRSAARSAATSPRSLRA